jgi:hypothetical protein
VSQYLTDISLDGIVAAPLSVPQVALSAQQPALPIAQFTLAATQILSMPYLTLHFIKYLTLGFTDKRNTGLPTVYVGIYYQTGSAQDMPLGRPVLYVGRDVPGVSAMPRSIVTTFKEPGLYRVLLVNNHVSSDVSVLVTGTVQISNISTNG